VLRLAQAPEVLAPLGEAVRPIGSRPAQGRAFEFCGAPSMIAALREEPEHSSPEEAACADASHIEPPLPISSTAQP
jgi:hypothetical protein